MSDMKFYEDKLGKLTYEGYLSRVNGGYRDYLIYSNTIFNGEGYFTKIIDLEYEEVNNLYTWETVEEMCENHLRIVYEMETFNWLREE